MSAKYLHGGDFTVAVHDKPAYEGHKPIELTDDELKYIQRVTDEYRRMQEWLRSKDIL